MEERLNTDCKKHSDSKSNSKNVPPNTDVTPVVYRRETTVETPPNRLNALFQNMLDAVLLADDEGHYVDANPAACELLGHSREQLLQMTVAALTPSVNREVALQAWAEFISKGQLSGEFTLQHQNGSHVEVEFRAVANVLPGLHVSVLRDITSRKQAEAALKQQNELLQTVLDHIPVLVNLLDQNGKIKWVNEEWERVLGWSLTDTQTLEFEEEFKFDLRDTERVGYLLQKTFTGWADFKTRNKAGKLLDLSWANVRLSDGTTIGIGKDVSERKRTEAELQASQQRLQIALSRGNVGLWDWNLETDKLQMSPQYKVQLGYRDDELDNHIETWRNTLHPEDLEKAWNRAQKIIEGQSDFYQSEFRLCHKDGSYRWFLSQGTVFRYPDGCAHRIIGVHIDITEMKNAEAELLTSRAALQHAHDELERRVEERTTELAKTNRALIGEIAERKMIMMALQEAAAAHQSAKEEAERANTAKSEFLSRMSHELRTPLNAILGFSQVLEADSLKPLQHESVGYILKAGEHLLELINEVLDIARVESGIAWLSIETVNIAELIAESISLMRPLALQRNVTLVEGKTEATLCAFADRQRLRQVLINLISNAIKYNNAGGTVTISALAKSGERLLIQVHDNGRGITAENIPKLFMPFERLDAESYGVEGTGLGLMVCRRLAEAMNGTLHVQSVPGEGSTFSIELPQSQSQQSQTFSAYKSEADVTTAANATTRHTVLSIEDNLANYRLTEVILESRPYISLLGAMLGQTGLDIARQQHPDLILLDLDLPDITGEEILKQLKNDTNTGNIPVVIVSADATNSQIERLLSSGATAYITKPLNISQFLNLIDGIFQDM